ncbi:MAG: ADP-ribosylglycohydrolase family protein [Clostridia bacterium]|nr:ADP-ribosylglycohydrolase family protein [Clostridia bacterium]
MITREDLRANPELLADKTRGALCGLAIGDSFGDAARKPDYQRDYGITTDFHRGDAWSTDDTEFALLVAETIIQAGGDFTSEDVEKMWKKHVVVQDELRRGGVSEMDAAANLRKGLHAPISGMFGTHNHSDGAAMRCGPIGIYCAGDVEKAKELCRIDAEISHCRDGVWGAQMVAVAVALAMVDAPWEVIFEEVLKCAPEESWLYDRMKAAYKVVEENNYDVADTWMKLHDLLFCSYRAATPEAMPEAFGCLMLKHDTFKSGVLLASNFGRDADTIGAVVGCILGARYGAKAIPPYWLEHTRYPSGTCLQFTKGVDLFEKAERLAELIAK